jgi:hypothetical protein
MRSWRLLLGVLLFWGAIPALPDVLPQTASDVAGCHVVEESARANHLSVAVLTRLIWYESRFRIGVVSRVGAQGVAQFMPATAIERGLLDPFDLDQAISSAASFLADLERHFGNIGLAVAAYNAGSGRVTNWLAKTETLPRETALFVLAVTGQTAEAWFGSGPSFRPLLSDGPQTCTALMVFLPTIRLANRDRQGVRGVRGMEQSGLLLPVMRLSGHPLPDFKQSGRMLPAFKDIGATLP